MIHLPNSSALWGVVCLLFMGPVVAAQPVVDDLTALALPDEYGFKRWGLELSSITRKDSVYYTVSEKCGLVYRLQINGNSVHVDSVIFLGDDAVWRDSAAIEGIASYHDWLLMVDEGNDTSDTASARLLAYDLVNQKLSVVEVDNGDYLRGRTGNYGAEGIAIQEADSLLYLLCEKDRPVSGNRPTKTATLARYKIIRSGIGIELQFQDTTKVKRKSEERFSDLSFNDSTNVLRTLLVKYHKRGGNQPERSKYYVCTLKVEPGQPVEVKDTIDFTGSLIGRAGYQRTSGYRISTNVEGLTPGEDGQYILVSDNAQTDRCGDTNLRGETGIFRLSLQ